MTERWAGARGRRVARGIALAGLVAGAAPGVAHGAISVSGPVAQLEGNPGGTATLDFTVSRPILSLQSATVRFRTTGGTATSGVDFTPVSRVVELPAAPLGQSVTVSVPVVGDLSDEVDETVSVTLDQATGDTISAEGGTASATISDDDAPPSLSIGDASGTEGTGAAGSVALPVAVTVPSGKAINVPYSVTAGTATAGDDVDVTAGFLTIPPGAAGGVVSVPTVGDSLDETDETFTATLGPVAENATIDDGEAVGTILNDDTPVGAVGSIALPEGDGNATTTFTFPITLSNPSVREVAFRVRTVDGQATAPADYATLDQVVTFAPGETEKSVAVAVVGDDAPERDEVFAVGLFEPVVGVVGPQGAGFGVIRDDDNGAGGGVATPIPFGTPLPTTPPAGSVDTSDPRVRVTALSYRRPRTLRATVSCPATEISCRGTVSVFNVPVRRSKFKGLRRETRFGRASYTLQGGASRVVTMTMTKTGRDLLRRAGRVRVRAFGVARDAAGNVGTATRATTIRK